MKKINLLLFIAIISYTFTSVSAQVPGAFNYQAVARNNTGAALTNSSVAVRLSIHDGSAGGSVIYSERDTATTNQFGLFNVQIGTGNVISGTFSTINWGAGTKFIQVDLDPTGGSSYATMGTSQLLSVPYALYAQTASNVGGSATISPSQITSGGATNNQILFWNGTNWVPGNESINSYSAGSGLNLTGSTFSVKPADFNEAPGFAASTSVVDISSLAETDIISVTITAPMAGHVLVNGQADYYCSTCADATEATSYQFWVTNVSGGSYANGSLGRLPGPATGSVSQAPIPRTSVQGVFSVTAGSVTFYLRGALTSGTEAVRVLRPSISALFIPN